MLGPMLCEEEPNFDETIAAAADFTDRLCNRCSKDRS